MDPIQYRGYTIQHDWRNPYSNTPEFMFYETARGIDHDADYDGESYTYCGNCKWAQTIEDAKAEIDDILLEIAFPEMNFEAPIRIARVPLTYKIYYR